MKKISIYTIAGALLLGSCTKDISNTLNHDPKKSAVAVGSALFTYGEQQLTNVYNTTSVAVAPFRVLSQEWTENTYITEAQYVFSTYNSPAGFWNANYINTIHNLDLAKQNFPVGFHGTPEQLKNEYIITDILEIYSYYMLVATYGNIPYSQAGNDAIPFPKYDDAKTVYTDLLTRIDTCIAGLSAAGDPAMGDADLIYGGDSGKWKKFAASLKLKMAMLNAAKDPTTTATKVNEAIAAGVFTSNDDNALFNYDAGSPGNSNPIWNALAFGGRHDFLPSDLLVSTMVGWNDPRLPLYFTQLDGAYSGGIPGTSNGYGSASDFCCVASSTVLYSASLPGDILDNAEIQFYLAEAAAQGFINTSLTEKYYDSAVTASILFWGGSSTDAATYLAQPNVAYATAPGSTWQQKIGYQEWIANYNRNWDSWTAIRRLGFPNIDVVSPPVGANGKFPLRLSYPPNETTSNPTNNKVAVAALPGGLDAVSAKLFWVP